MVFEGMNTDSPYYWFCRIMAATSREDRRAILERVPEHLRELVEYTVRDHFEKMKLKPNNEDNPQ